MSIIAQIRNSKQCLRVVVLLALALINGLYSQSYSAIPVKSNTQLAMSANHSQHIESADHVMSSEHNTHQVAQYADCTSDAVCKSQCAWHCLLTQVVQPVAFSIDASAVLVTIVPSYQSKITATAVVETKIRPPITV
jgi:hypothetical protein